GCEPEDDGCCRDGAKHRSDLPAALPRHAPAGSEKQAKLVHDAGSRASVGTRVLRDGNPIHWRHRRSARADAWKPGPETANRAEAAADRGRLALACRVLPVACGDVRPGMRGGGSMSRVVGMWIAVLAVAVGCSHASPVEDEEVKHITEFRLSREDVVEVSV